MVPLVGGSRPWTHLGAERNIAAPTYDDFTVIAYLDPRPGRPQSVQRQWGLNFTGPRQARGRSGRKQRYSDIFQSHSDGFRLVGQRTGVLSFFSYHHHQHHHFHVRHFKH